MKFDMETALSKTTAKTEHGKEVTGLVFDDKVSDYCLVGVVAGHDQRWDEWGNPREAWVGRLVND